MFQRPTFEPRKAEEMLKKIFYSLILCKLLSLIVLILYYYSHFRSPSLPTILLHPCGLCYSLVIVMSPKYFKQVVSVLAPKYFKQVVSVLAPKYFKQVVSVLSPKYFKQVVSVLAPEYFKKEYSVYDPLALERIGSCYDH